MEETLISFETAKLAKEKGFDINTAKKYIFRHAEHKLKDYIGILTDRPLHCDILAPTQSLLQKWIREIHNIHIEIQYILDGTFVGDLIYDNAPYEYNDTTAPYDAEDCKTYEETLEILLQKALNLI